MSKKQPTIRKKLLFIDHEFHQHTKSNEFLTDLFEEEYELERVYINPESLNVKIPIQNLICRNYDIVVIFQVMPSLIELKKYINFKKVVFFPMFDGIPPLNSIMWKNYRMVRIISFSKTLYTALKKRGVDVKYIQYFPKPEKFLDWGADDSLFYWQRVNNLPIQKLINQMAPFFNKIHIHSSLDPYHHAIKIKTEKEVSTSTWFEKRSDLNQKILESALFIAPRLSEGIGMSFLEAMAMGRCVIAPNFPTMNEYIQNGETGFLYDVEKIEAIKIQNIKEVQRKTYEYILRGYNKWLKQKKQILKWLSQPAKREGLLSCKRYFLFGIIPLFWRKK